MESTPLWEFLKFFEVSFFRISFRVDVKGRMIEREQGKAS